EDRRSKELEIDRRISIRDVRIKELEQELERERWRNALLKSQMRQLISSPNVVDGVKLTVLPSLSKEKIDELGNEVPEGVLLALDATGASTSILRRLKEIGIRAVLYRGSPPPKEFIERAEFEGITIAPLNQFKISWKGLDPVLPSEEALKLLSTVSTQQESKEIGSRSELDVLNIIRDYRMALLRAVSGGEESTKETNL
ncbi:MAG: hypothetical protein QI199_05930, partial [Candidatus Korarchaeota archaeon]|nr:hypothetical protein [Candidatus Korarchaeota archaeon]